MSNVISLVGVMLSVAAVAGVKGTSKALIKAATMAMDLRFMVRA
jgi:hypothetical protein